MSPKLIKCAAATAALAAASVWCAFAGEWQWAAGLAFGAAFSVLDIPAQGKR